jgi:O-antigen ligase
VRSLGLVAAAAGLVVLPPVGAAAWLAVLLASPRRRRPELVGPGVAVAVVGAASAWMAGSGVQGVVLVVALTAIAGAAAWWSAVAAPDDARAVAIGFAVGVLVQGAAAAVDLAGGSPWPIDGTTRHQNELGALLAVTLPSIVAVVVAGRRNPIGMAAVVLGPALVVGTGSRGALVAAAAAALAAVAVAARRGSAGRARTTPRRRLATNLLVALLAAFVVVAAWTWVRRPTVEQAFGLTGRGTLWGAAIELIVGRPVLGHGPTAWTRLVAAVEPSISPSRFVHTHSGYLEVAVVCGLVGLAYVVAYFVAMGRGLLRRGRPPPGRWRIAALASLAAFAATNVADVFVTDARFVAILILIWGAAIAAEPGGGPGPVQRESEPEASGAAPTARA